MYICTWIYHGFWAVPVPGLIYTCINRCAMSDNLPFLGTWVVSVPEYIHVHRWMCYEWHHTIVHGVVKSVMCYVWQHTMDVLRVTAHYVYGFTMSVMYYAMNVSTPWMCYDWQHTIVIRCAMSVMHYGWQHTGCAMSVTCCEWHCTMDVLWVINEGQHTICRIHRRILPCVNTCMCIHAFAVPLMQRHTLSQRHVAHAILHFDTHWHSRTRKWRRGKAGCDSAVCCSVLQCVAVCYAREGKPRWLDNESQVVYPCQHACASMYVYSIAFGVSLNLIL